MPATGNLGISPPEMDGFSEMTPALHFRRVVVAAGAFDPNSHDAGHRDVGRCVDGPTPLAGRTCQRGLVIVGNEYFMHGSYLFVFILLVTNRCASGKGVACPDENPNDIHPLQAAPADGLLNKVIDRR